MDMPKKKCLIIADGPVPVPEHPLVEGGGLRTWGLAQGILKNDSSIDVTVAYHDRFKKKEFTDYYQGIKITTHATAEDAIDLIANYDTVIISYSMGDLSVVVAENVRPDQQLVLDCNVPAYVEVSARESTDLEQEYIHFNNDVNRFARVLRRGDLFLCASEAQKRYYLGVLSGLGRINPVTYKQDLILIVPYGIYREEPQATHKPITDLLNGDKQVKKVLWFGGIYPWFDLDILIDAVKDANKSLPMKLVIVGAKNPFNGHPDFIRKYDELLAYIEKSQSSEIVKVIDWVDFNDRANWYLDSDAVVTINKIGPENELAWRTRLVDYTWASVPILTNGGDPLGEMLVKNDAALLLPALDKETISHALTNLLGDTTRVGIVKKNMSKVKQLLYWDVVTRTLAKAIQENTRAEDLSTYGQYSPMAGTAAGPRNKVRSIINKAKQLPAYAKKHGARNTYHVVKSIAVRRIRRYAQVATGPHKPRIVVISHQLDISGAPFVIMDIVREIKELYPTQRIDFHTYNPAHDSQIKTLNKIGIKPHIYMSRDAVPVFGEGDTLILNTIAHSSVIKNAIYESLERGILKKLVWYIHEDNPEYLFTPSEIQTIRALINKGKIVMFTAATRTKQHYDNFFGTDKVRIQNYRVITPKKYHKIRKEGDFNKIDFLLTGVAADGRKGQLTIFYAFAYFLKNFYNKNPEDYRDFSLTYVGLGPDLVSQQLKNHAKSALGSRLKTYPVLPKEKTMDITLKSNFTICYSLLECLPLFVYEGMIAGHPIFRNDCSGIEEQLEDGKNGFYLETKDFWQVVDTIEKTLSKKHTSNKLLASMSKRAYEISKLQENNSYKPMIDEVI